MNFVAADASRTTILREKINASGCRRLHMTLWPTSPPHWRIPKQLTRP